MNELNRTKSIKRNNLPIHIVMMVFSLFCILPFILIISISLSSEKDIAMYGYSLVPRKFSLLAYEVILKDPRQLINSYLVTISVTVIGTILGLWLITSLAFVLTRKDYKHREQAILLYFFYNAFQRWTGTVLYFGFHMVRHEKHNFRTFCAIPG